MKIKEAARVCGLTEKAIRFYEEKGLIRPDLHIYQQNGRAFRDYDDETVRRLQTIAGLRRSFFSVEQISRMLDSPEAVREVYPEYLAELKERYAQLDGLLARADALPAEALVSAEALSAALDTDRVPASVPESGTEDRNVPAASAPPVSTEKPELHFHIWDEEDGRDERDRLRERYFGSHAKWGVWYDVSLVLRKAGRWLLIAAAVLLLLLFVPYIEKVDVRYTGYELLFDPTVTNADGVPVVTEIRPREIMFSGNIYHYLFRDTVFKGNIDIEGYSYLTWNLAADIRGLEPLTVPGRHDARRAFVMEKNQAGVLTGTKPPKIVWKGYDYQVVSGTTEETYLLRDDRQVRADAVCVYRNGKLSPGAVFLLRPRPDEVTGGYLCGYTGVLVFPAESEAEAETMFSDTVWKHWREEYGFVTAILPF